MSDQPDTNTTPLKAAGLLAGGALGSALLVLGAAGIASAQDDAPTLDDPTPAEAEGTEDDGADEDRPNRREVKEARRQAMIDQLVDDGVITQDQVDDWQAVRDAVHEQREAQRAERQQAIADAAGVTVDELQAAREEGTSLADLAGDNLPAVVDVIAEEMTAKINQAVEDGHITQEQADERLDGLEARIEARLEDGGFGRDGRRGNRGHGRGGPGADVDATEAVAA